MSLVVLRAKPNPVEKFVGRLFKNFLIELIVFPGYFYPDYNNHYGGMHGLPENVISHAWGRKWSNSGWVEPTTAGDGYLE